MGLEYCKAAVLTFFLVISLVYGRTASILEIMATLSIETICKGYLGINITLCTYKHSLLLHMLISHNPIIGYQVAIAINMHMHLIC